jgi:hypothetical protein
LKATETYTTLATVQMNTGKNPGILVPVKPVDPAVVANWQPKCRPTNPWERFVTAHQNPAVVSRNQSRTPAFEKIAHR